MPLQNRVMPTQEIVRDPHRGLIMGNRGCLHGPDRELGAARWRSRLWLSCVLDWNGRRRDVMPPGRWTALFFLDEATALAAGHRPCAYCRRGDYLAYARAWQAATGAGRRPWAAEMDATLHAERVRRDRTQIVWRSRVGDLPDLAMVRDRYGIGLLRAGAVRPWSPGGYGPARPVTGEVVDVLTPPSSVAALACGYVPVLHPSTR
jgi:hypothetical protein